MKRNRALGSAARCAGSLVILFLLGAPAPSAETVGNTLDWHTTVRDFAAQHFRHPAWGYSHSVRDYWLARELAAADPVQLDDDVLYAAAYLHDMAAFAPWDREKEWVDHADAAVAGRARDHSA